MPVQHPAAPATAQELVTALSGVRTVVQRWPACLPRAGRCRAPSPSPARSDRRRLRCPLVPPRASSQRARSSSARQHGWGAASQDSHRKGRERCATTAESPAVTQSSEASETAASQREERAGKKAGKPPRSGQVQNRKVSTTQPDQRTSANRNADRK